MTSTYPAGVLTPELRAALRAEWRRVLSPPYEVLLVFTFNGVLMIGAWYLLPELFNLHDIRVFPVSLAVWMYADVPATNVLGTDAAVMRTLLDRPAELRRALTARCLVLWMLATPICILVTVYVDVDTRQTVATLISTLLILVVTPFGVLAVAGWLGILFPYHALPLRVRWSHRRPLSRMVVRWLALVLTPYVWVPALGWVVLTPSFVVLWLLGSSWLQAADLLQLVGSLVLVASSAVMWRVGLAGSLRLASRRRTTLEQVLADPLQG